MQALALTRCKRLHPRLLLLIYLNINRHQSTSFIVLVNTSSVGCMDGKQKIPGAEQHELGETPQQNEAVALETQIRAAVIEALLKSEFPDDVKAASSYDPTYKYDYASCLASKLHQLGYWPNQVEGYVRVANQCLGSLYLEAMLPKSSPLKLKELGKRYAFNAQYAAPPQLYIVSSLHYDNLHRMYSEWYDITNLSFTDYKVRRAVKESGPGRWHSVDREIDVPTIRVADSRSVYILDRVLEKPPESSEIAAFIEELFQRVPTESDALPPETPPGFTFQIDNRGAGVPRIDLWIGDKKVNLPEWQDIHKLLIEICKRPTTALKGSDFKKEPHRITNPSAACGKIREALEATFPGAGNWLETRPEIRWKDGIRPQKRSKCPPSENT